MFLSRTKNFKFKQENLKIDKTKIKGIDLQKSFSQDDYIARKYKNKFGFKASRLVLARLRFTSSCLQYILLLISFSRCLQAIEVAIIF